MRHGLLWILALLAVGLWTIGCGSESRSTDDEVCDNGVDDDDDGDVDCDDSDCALDPACDGEVEICDNGEDDDGDGDVDCDDRDCRSDPACEEDPEICDNDVDDDGDGDVDCDDSDCRTDPACEGEVETDCDNDVDDDGDGDVDCDDSDCRTDPACEGEVETDCDNDIDDDDDGDIDCDDSDCDGDPACEAAVEDCDNGLDDDGDGDADCLDSDCASDPFCVEDCDDGVDNDLDGDTDCGDADCASDPYCAEDCDNGVDDDGDELVDCMDPSCDFDLACAELCNGIDDDGDGRVDEHPIDPSIGEACYDGDPALAGIGQCEYGVRECFGGALICLGWVAPSEELCDGVDNDCDGTVPAEEASDDCGTSVTPGDPTNLEFGTEVRDVDVHINLDTTGSMGGELATLQAALSTTIVPEIRTVLPTSAFGVSTFDDFPLSPFGSEGAGDLPYVLHQRVTTNVADVQAAIDAVGTHSGTDGPESGVEALHQVATGDGVSWPIAGWRPEDCRNGRDDDGDGDTDCDDADCDLDGWCWRVDEDCDNGVDDDGDGYVDCNDPNCIVYGVDPACTPLTPGTCGDGVIDLGEDCDDGNTASGDGCDGTCDLESGCGNGLLGRADWTDEECDDGNTDDGDGCSSTCTIEAGVCGDGVLGPLEQCDDSGTTAGDGCDATCHLEGACGDGVTNPGEECDDGGFDLGDGCDDVCNMEDEGIAPWDWTVGYDPGLGHGNVGGVGFRSTALPVVVHITDNVSHEADDYTSAGITAHSSTEAFAALAGIGARVVGVWSGSDVTMETDDVLYPLGMTMETGAVVPVCAFDGSAPRLAGDCLDDECCTGIGGAGVPPIGTDCPLFFDVGGSGAGLDESIVTAIDALSRFVTYDLTVVPRDDPADGVDALCFVETLGISSFTPPAGACSTTPTGVDSDGDGVLDTVTDATPRTTVTFEVSVVNTDINDVDGDGDTAEACATTGSYGIFLDVLADGATVVSTRRMTVEIP